MPMILPSARCHNDPSSLSWLPWSVGARALLPAYPCCPLGSSVQGRRALTCRPTHPQSDNGNHAEYGKARQLVARDSNVEGEKWGVGATSKQGKA